MGRYSRHYFTLRRPLIFTSIVGRPATIEERRTSNVQPTIFRPTLDVLQQLDNVVCLTFSRQISYNV